jgi:hypothetical protein
MENKLRENIERLKIKAEDFLNNNIKAFIIDIDGTWYSCEILVVGEVSLLVNNFEGDDLGHKKLYWADIVTFTEWKPKEERGK